MATLWSALSNGGPRGSEIIRTMHQFGSGRLRVRGFGLAALACVLSALLWLAIVPAAWAAARPTLTDTSPGSTDAGSKIAAAVGDNVTLQPGSYDLDPGGTGFLESWYDCPSLTPPATLVGALPAGCTAITPAPSSPYKVTPSDQGSFITVYETDPNLLAQVSQTPSNTLAVPAAPPPPPPPPPAPMNKAAPSIAGTPTTGSTLTAVSGLWTGTGNTYSYRWSRCNKDHTVCNPRSAAATYQLTSDDVGGYLFLTQIATATHGGVSSSAQATSAPLGPITTPAGKVPPPNPPGAGNAVPTVAGTAQVGATLTGAPVTMSNNPNYGYQWLRCPGQSCTAIPGATSPTYGPSAADLGDALVFSETGTNAGGTGQAQSTKTAVVTAPTETTLQITPSGVVAGQTATLVATVTSATGQAPPTGVITFEQAGAAISGCASMPTHPLGASATITCQTTFSGSASTLSAIFTPSPGSQVTGSDSTAIGFVLGRAATATTMILPPDVTLGKRLTLRAKVVGQAGTKGVSPTGDVVFLDGKKAINGCLPTLADGIAHCVVTYQALGTHSISAVYLGDGNFSGSSTHAHKLAVLVAKPSGYVGSLMTWTFSFRPHYTRVTTLAVTNVQPGLTISVGCSGSGCPKHRYIDTVTRATCGKRGTCKNVNLAKRFAGRKLGVGARLTVRLTHPGWLGKYYSFEVRHGRKPKIDTACLAVGQAKPGAGCTPQ